MDRRAAALAAILSLTCLPLQSLGKSTAGKPTLHLAREAETDLEVGGDLAGLPPGSTRFITYKDLLALPQVTYSVTDDHNFAGKVQIAGIPLDHLGALVGAAPAAQLAIAICYDGYRANYPADYLAAHRPLLVLRVNGKTQDGWPKSEHNGSLGPYLISHPIFVPAFRVLSHVDQPQVPFGVVRIDFREQQAVFGAIAPVGNHAPDSAVMSGYRIARQNCFRCHNMGAEGGQLAGHSWQMLGMWAATEPQFFVRFVKNPQSIDRKDRMPGNPDYDTATLEALRRYFAGFAAMGNPGGGK